jgi:hypothetical protein
VTYINSDSSAELSWASRQGASSLRPVGLRGTSMPIAAHALAVHAVQRVRGKVAFVAPPTQQDVVSALLGSALLGQTNIHNYMTRAYAVGEGASGPPREEPV